MISFSIEANSSLLPEQICKEFFDVNNWGSFKGYGPLPGVKNVIKEAPHDTEVGTIFSVTNTDGSTHKEVVEAYNPGQRIVIRMDSFSPPLRHMATHFFEFWEFEETDMGCRLTRSFELYPRNRVSAVPLWIISRLLKKAVEIHTNIITKPQKT
jgi:hypothetical protein